MWHVGPMFVNPTMSAHRFCQLYGVCVVGVVYTDATPIGGRFRPKYDKWTQRILLAAATTAHTLLPTTTVKIVMMLLLSQSLSPLNNIPWCAVHGMSYDVSNMTDVWHDLGDSCCCYCCWNGNNAVTCRACWCRCRSWHWQSSQWNATTPSATRSTSRRRRVALAPWFSSCGSSRCSSSCRNSSFSKRSAVSRMICRPTYSRRASQHGIIATRCATVHVTCTLCMSSSCYSCMRLSTKMSSRKCAHSVPRLCYEALQVSIVWEKFTGRCIIIFGKTRVAFSKR